MLHELRVGGAYIEGTDEFAEGALFSHTGPPVVSMLSIFWKSPDDDEIRMFESGDIEFRLLVEAKVLCLLFRFETDDPRHGWSDVCMNWHILPGENRLRPEVGDALDLHMVLVDAGTGVISAMRAVRVKGGFTRLFTSTLAAQAEGPDMSVDVWRQIQVIREFPSALLASYATQVCLVNQWRLN